MEKINDERRCLLISEETFYFQFDTNVWLLLLFSVRCCVVIVLSDRLSVTAQPKNERNRAPGPDICCEPDTYLLLLNLLLVFCSCALHFSLHFGHEYKSQTTKSTQQHQNKQRKCFEAFSSRNIMVFDSLYRFV